MTPGSRPFEVQMVRDAVPTAWFTRHGYDVPDAKLGALDEMHLPAEVRLIEEPTFKRRWLFTDWEAGVDAARRVELLGFCESRWGDAVEAGRGMARIVLRQTPGAAQIAPPGDEVTLAQWIRDDSVPYLAAHRHTEPGLEKRAVWERVWDLQRAEDRGETVPPFDPPPKYDQKDYRDAASWRQRGKLDVPKERFISYPGCESDEDREPIYGWAGWNHLQQAQALASLYQKRKTEESWGKDRLVPMLAGLLELVPWVKQWHNDPSAEFGGLRLGDYFESFLDGECHALGVTREELRAWRPEGRGRGKARKDAGALADVNAEPGDVGPQEGPPAKARGKRGRRKEP